MRLLTKLAKSVIFYSLIVIISWVVYLFVTGGYICSTVELIDGKSVNIEKTKCFYNSPLPFSVSSINSLSQDLWLYGFGLVVIIIPIALLILRDSYFQKKGLSNPDTHLTFIKGLVSPFMLLISLLFIYGSWWIANRDNQLGSFMIGAAIGTIGGIGIVYKYSSISKKQLRRVSLNIISSVTFIIIFMTWFGISRLKVETYSFLDENTFMTSILTGSASVFTFFVSITHFILAVRRKYSLLNF